MSSTTDKRTQGWPSLEQQLAAAKAIPGSALDRLIRGNQDLHMLDPGEIHDVFQLPPWLRVYWRKKHPEINKKGRISYPSLLRRLRQWMVAHQDLNEDLISMKPAGPPK
jgi:hypothetical protein